MPGDQQSDNLVGGKGILAFCLEGFEPLVESCEQDLLVPLRRVRCQVSLA
jgi:hypothetical protein